MRTAIWAFATTFILVPGILYAKEVNPAPIQARPVRIVSCDNLPTDLNFEFPPLDCDHNLQIDYLIEGEHLVAIKDDSLVLDFIKTEEGSDLSKYQNGRQAYEQGSFPEISEDGRYGVFSIEVKQNQWGYVDNLSIKGTITVLTSEKSEEKEIKLSVNDQQEKTVGPFSVVIDLDTSQNFFGSSEEDEIGVQLTGPLGAIIEVQLFDAGEELDSQSSMSSSTPNSTETTFFFPKPKSTEVLLRVSYWVDLQEQEVILGE